MIVQSGNTGIVPPWLQHPIVILPVPGPGDRPMPTPPAQPTTGSHK